MRRILLCFIVLSLLLSGCSFSSPKLQGVQISLSDIKITVDGNEITNDRSKAVYAANDIVFYLAGQDAAYGEGTPEDAHEQNEADAHTVVHITKPGTYILSGALSLGQIAIDLGEDAEDNPNAVVTIILNDVDITCTVAPAIIFYNVYECCSRDAETATKDVDTTKAGANVIIADNTENNINGSYVAKIYQSYEISADGTEASAGKTLHKYDGAFYSKQTMNINGGIKGSGILNITAENEGLDSELHLTINGGIIHIVSGNDGINTNEDQVSVTTINGGTLDILCCGSTGEGDGIDSNGWLVINGGTVIAQACATSGDAGIDSDQGIYIHGGKVIASGNMLDRIAGGNQTYAVFSFANRQNGNDTYTLNNSSGETVWEYAPTNAFTYLIAAGDELSPGEYTFWQGTTQFTANAVSDKNGEMPQGSRPNMPNGEQPPQGNMPPEVPAGQEMPGQPNGEPPQMPYGEPPEMPNGERPEMPEGMTPPNDRGGMMGGHMIANGEASATFTIVKGGNQFANVSPKR